MGNAADVRAHSNSSPSPSVQEMVWDCCVLKSSLRLKIRSVPAESTVGNGAETLVGELSTPAGPVSPSQRR